MIGQHAPRGMERLLELLSRYSFTCALREERRGNRTRDEMATRFRLGLGGAARWLAARPRLLAAGAGVSTFGLGVARTAAVCEPAPLPPPQRTKVLCLHGINLNMFGKRDAGTYGTATLQDIDASLRTLAAELDVEVECFQTNHEGEAARRKQAGSDHGQLAPRRLLSAREHASGCSKLRSASANQPVEPRPTRAAGRNRRLCGATACHPSLLALTREAPGGAAHAERAAAFLPGPNGRLLCGREARPKPPIVRSSILVPNP